MPMPILFQLPYVDEKTNDYRLLELDETVMLISILFSDQEINWPLVIKLVSNETLIKILKSVNVFSRVFFSLRILH